MAQHDYVIANQSGSSFRSDLNSALSAIVSQNSGSSEPSTTYAYQTWADTTNGVMKMRNGANSAWITLYQLDGEWSTIAFENGTAAAPSIYFKDSGTDTGFYSPGTDQVAVTTGGTERINFKTAEVVINDGGANYDFRVEGDADPNLLVCDASADFIGIGNTSPGTKLDVTGNLRLSAANPVIELNSGGPQVYSDASNRLNFAIGGGIGTPTRRYTITSDGINHLFGKRGTDVGLPISGSGNLRIAADAAGGYCISTFDTNNYTAVQFVREVSGSGAQVGTITCTDTATAYNTSSDYRLKENVVPLTGAIDRINQLQVHRFNFIVNPDKTVDGFLAHEAQAVVPECVTGTKDEVDDEGNAIYQGIDQSKLVPLLTAALQEALAEIESLKTRITALEP